MKMIFNYQMQMNACKRQTLAMGELAVVEQCSCGAVHVTIGAITLRLAPSSIVQIATTMNEAARSLLLDQALSVHEVHGGALS
jgi:hypothetical protein